LPSAAAVARPVWLAREAPAGLVALATMPTARAVVSPGLRVAQAVLVLVVLAEQRARPLHTSAARAAGLVVLAQMPAASAAV
jgi:hypothetical protein